MFNFFLVEDKSGISLMNLVGHRPGYSASEMIRKQLVTFGVKHELPLALLCSVLGFGIVSPLQHRPVTAVLELSLPPGPLRRHGSGGDALRKPLVDLSMGNECSLE